MKIREADSQLRPALEAFADRHGSFFNSGSWVSLYRKGLVQCVILNNNDEVIGCFIFYRFRKFGLNFVITPPYSPDISLVYDNPGGSVVGRNSFDKQVAETICAYFLSLNAHAVSVQLPATIKDSQPFIWKGFISQHRFTYVLDPDRPESALWSNLSGEKRKSISKAKKDGLEVKQCRDVQVVHALIRKSLQRQGLYRHEQLLDDLLNLLFAKDQGFAFVTYRESEPLAASVCVIDNGKALYLFGGFEQEGSHHGAGVLSMWQCILHAKSAGLREFDFEGSMHPGIERYFREFGGELRSYTELRKVSTLLKMVLYLTGRKL